jgi:hypothetical protein
MFKVIELGELDNIVGGNAFSRVFAAGAVDAITGRKHPDVKVRRSQRWTQNPEKWSKTQTSWGRPGVIDDVFP